jgi:hypothetical protein
MVPVPVPGLGKSVGDAHVVVDQQRLADHTLSEHPPGFHHLRVKAVSKTGHQIDSRTPADGNHFVRFRQCACDRFFHQEVDARLRLRPLHASFLAFYLGSATNEPQSRTLKAGPGAKAPQSGKAEDAKGKTKKPLR